MANWCENDLIIEADGEEAEKELEQVKKWIKQTNEEDGHADVGFESIIGTDTERASYLFNVEITTDDKDRLEASFETKWSTPSQGLLLLSKKFPLLDIRSHGYEQGCGFMTALHVKGGEILYDKEMEYYGPRGG